MHIGTSSSNVREDRGRCSWRVGRTPRAPERGGGCFWRTSGDGRSQSAVHGCGGEREEGNSWQMFMTS